MKILITGASGFLGKNLAAALGCIKNGTDAVNSDLEINDILLYDKEDGRDTLEKFCRECDFVFHFAGVNRVDCREDFFDGNTGCARELVKALSRSKNNCPVVFASSEKVETDDSDYASSKREAEDIFLEYSASCSADVMIYRFTHIFGKLCRENYNSVVATFCHNTARSLPIKIVDPDNKISLVYIDDLVKEMLSAIRGEANRISSDGCLCKVLPVYQASVYEIAGLIKSFDENIRTLKNIGDFSSEFEKKLFSTYLSYIPSEMVAVALSPKYDPRGSFTELFRGNISGLVSLNVINPGETKGGHWHNSKCEVFIPACGEGIVRQRRIGDGRVYETKIDARNPSALYILPGYTHSIINTSANKELAVIIWASETYDPKKPDTYKEDV